MTGPAYFHERQPASAGPPAIAKMATAIAMMPTCLIAHSPFSPTAFLVLFALLAGTLTERA